jgi:hypothetical protein
MVKLKAGAVVTLLIVFLFGAIHADPGKDESGKGRERESEARQKAEGNSYFHRHGYTRLDIPKGHYPPPGECRVWFPDRPAGHQPPPGNCARLGRKVPPGAWLIHHPDDSPGHVRVNVYDERQPGKIHAVGEFKIGSGVFVRVVID